MMGFVFICLHIFHVGKPPHSLHISLDNHMTYSHIRCNGRFSNGYELTLANSSRASFTAFHYPGNGHVYVSLARRAFSDFIFDCIGFVSDWYSLHSSSLHATLCIFDEAQILDVIKDSDEESGGFAEILH